MIAVVCLFFIETKKNKITEVMEKIMTNGLSNFEVLKQKISTSPKDSFLKGQQPRVGEVLIVDDEESFVLSLAEGLSVYRKFFNVRTAPNGAESVKVLKLSPIDLVITDLNMPKMDGFELLAYMKRNYPKIPVILMTAYGTPKIEEIVSNMGIFRYLEKPLDIYDIADNIFDALGIKTSPTSEEIQKTDSPYKPSTTFAQRTSISASDVQNKIALAKKASEEEKNKAKAEAQAIAEMEGKSKTVATFGSRTSLSASDLEKLREEARTKLGAKAKDHVEKKSTTNAEKQAAEAAEKRALLEAKAKAEAERLAREGAERKVKEAEERARQEALAREEAQRKAKEAEERAQQEALAREEAQRKAKEAEERARQEALAREEAIKKAKAEAEAKAQAEEKARQEDELKAKEAQTRVTDKTQKDLKKETQQKLSAWKKG
jgi:YesN/AraC family two-component response regulator